MTERTYWLDLFTLETWREFHAAGAQVSGFRESRWNVVRQLKPGDYLLCYLVRASRFIGVLEVTSEPFQDSTAIWTRDVFPCRVKVRVVQSLDPDNAIPIMELRDELSFFDSARPNVWIGHVRGSPSKWRASDAELIMRAIQARIAHPRPVPIPPPAATPRPIAAKDLGSVTVPDSGNNGEDDSLLGVREPRLHTEIQWLLLKLGSDLGLDVWVASNDRGLEHNGLRFATMSRLRQDLPLQFDEATTRTIKLIDVLWLSGNTIMAAFEIECTTSIYSGLLRMADLIAMQPNLRIPLYLVAPEERRDKVVAEVNRPTFSRLRPPMKHLCKFISIPRLRGRVAEAERGSFIQYMRPEFLETLAESCELEDV